MARSRASATTAALVLCGFTMLLPIRSTLAAPSCAASCVGRMAACRAERCPAATGKDRSHCRDVCRAVTGCAAGAARIRTMATVVNRCRASNGSWTVAQHLEIRRGDCAPITLMAIEGSEPVVDFGACALYGQGRQGGSAEVAGVLHRVAVSPDARTIVFELTDDFTGRLVIDGTPIPTPPVELATEGIFVVRADGSDLRRIADQTREAPFAVRRFPSGPGGISIVDGNSFDFSPDGKSLVFVDRGPGSDGVDAPQIFTMDVATGVRHQLTTFASVFVGTNPQGLFDLIGVFLDDRQIGGYVYDSAKGLRYFTIARDGANLRFFEDPSPLPGLQLIPDFGIVGGATAVYSLAFANLTTDQPRPGAVREVFVRNGQSTLQLTNYGRSDTGAGAPPIRLRDHEHVVFPASADPVGLNPEHGVQLFRIDTLGGHVRQLTHFAPSASVPVACTGAPTATCTTPVNLGIKQDPIVGTLVVDSSCDPLGLSPVSQQLYALRPDGSGFRQITNYRGLTCDDGAVDVELPGPIAYSAPFL
jgi:hypothetical protein